MTTDNEMPPGEGDITLTRELLHACSSNGFDAFTRATVEAFGVTYPASKGWLSALIGTTITRHNYRAALDGRFIRVTKGDTRRRLRHQGQSSMDFDGI